jgi:phosphoglycolate phosphatase
LLIIFDLDGTLIDSSEDLAVSVNATRQNAGLSPLDPAVINSYVGNGAPTLIRRAMGPGTPEDVIAESLSFFLKFYRSHALSSTDLYPGIREMVQAAQADGHVQAVLTNKPRKISFDIIDGLNIGEFFVSVHGGDSLPAKKPDPVGIFTIMTETGHNADETLMVGDSSVDIETAKNAGVRSCGVRWGFKPETFEIVRPDFQIEHPQDLLPHLAG